MTGLPVQPAVPAHFQTFLAFDFGLKRTGVATGNRMLRSATPQATIKAEGDARFVQVAQRIKEWQPDALVIGVPYHPDGASHENTEKALNSAASCAGALACKCSRWTSATAPLKPSRAVPRMPTLRRPASSWNSF